MANTLLTISYITNDALRTLVNLLSFTRLVDRQYDDKFARDGAKIGNVCNVRKPPKYLGRTGDALAVEDATETQVAVTLDTKFGVDLEFSSTDLALSIDNFRDRFIKPAIARIANKIDADGLKLFRQVYHSVGTPGTVPNAILTYLLAGVKLDDSAAPMDGMRSIVMSPIMQATIVDALKGLFQKADEIGKQYAKGRMGTSGGFDWHMDQNVASHTVGPLGGTPLTNGAGQTGANIVTDGWTASAALRLNQGDVIQIAGVNQISVQEREDLGVLQDFVATAPVSSDAGGNATIPIDPPIVVSGSGQTVSAAPADGAAITIFGHASSHADKVTRQGLAFHRDAFTLATADLPLPRGTDMAGRASDDQVGLSIRMVRDYSIETDRFPCRLDVLYGWAVLRPELACRICS